MKKSRRQRTAFAPLLRRGCMADPMQARNKADASLSHTQKEKIIVLAAVRERSLKDRKSADTGKR